MSTQTSNKYIFFALITSSIIILLFLMHPVNYDNGASSLFYEQQRNDSRLEKQLFVKRLIINESNIHPVVIHKKEAAIDSSNGRITVLFVAGIEGTGHHLWLEISRTMSKYFPQDVNVKYYGNNGPYGLARDLKHCFLSMTPKDATPSKGAVCNSVKKDLKQIYVDQYKDVLDRNEKKNILMHLRSYSYPFGKIELNVSIPHIPNIIGLNSLINEVNEELHADIFKLKFIVSKREWVSAIVSSCINRFGKCHKRAAYLPEALRLLNMQLVAIPTDQWFIIKYDDFVQRSLEYKDIISEWLNIESEIVEKGLSSVNKKKGAQDAVQKAWNDVSAVWSRVSDSVRERQNLTGLKDKIIDGFYSEKAKRSAPLFYDDCVVVSPENTQFMQDDFKCDVLQ